MYSYSGISGIVLRSNLFIDPKIHFSKTENVQPPELTFSLILHQFGLKKENLDNHFLSILVDFYTNQKHFSEKVEH